jgi:predicted ester cyclase
MNKFYAFFVIFFTTPLFANEVLLIDRMRSLDTQVFQAFNNCQNQQDLDQHASYFSEDVEFYHDNGGVTWDRKTMISNTKKYVCGNFTRKLIPASFNAYPVKDFGAITEGVHIFCQIETQECEGKANFVMVWRNINDKWVITRVLSYGHGKNN